MVKNTKEIQSEVVLVQMPDAALTPSLALALLKRGMAEDGVSCRVEYASHRFVRQLGYERYRYISNALSLIADRGWEITFAPYTDFRPAVGVDELLQNMERELAYQKNNLTQSTLGEPLAKRLIQTLRSVLRQFAVEIPAFLEAEADCILAGNPKIVGFSVMTQQRNASFALCRILKEKNPALVTILGGGVCVGEAAKQFLRHVPSLDYVFTGEGDRGLASACRTLLAGNEPGAHPYLLRRGAEPRYLPVEDMDTVPTPDFSDYDEILRGDAFRDQINMQAPMEASRGCWWGMRRRCRFCGLHYCRDEACYREKSPEKFWREIEQVNRVSGFTAFQLADCILSPRLVDALPEVCPEERRGYNFFAECRTDLQDDALRRLAENRFLHLQPGIESLQDDILRLMRKGRRVEDQLLFLRRCVQYGIKAIWNIIYAIPGEEDAWYEEMLALMKKLHHLQPPTSVRPMLLARGSEFHLHAKELGVTWAVRLSERACSPDDRRFQVETADYFAMDAKRISPAVEARLMEETRAWNADHRKGAALFCRFTADTAEIADCRRPEQPRYVRLTGTKKALLEAGEEIVCVPRLAEKLGVEPDRLESALRELEAQGFLYRKRDLFLSLVCPETRAVPTPLRRSEPQ